MFVKHHTVDVVILQTHVVLLSQTDLEKTNDVTGIYVKRERFFIKQFIILSLARGCFI